MRTGSVRYQGQSRDGNGALTRIRAAKKRQPWSADRVLGSSPAFMWLTRNVVCLLRSRFPMFRAEHAISACILCIAWIAFVAWITFVAFRGGCGAMNATKVTVGVSHR